MTGTGHGPVPPPLRLAGVCLVALLVVLAALPVLMALDPAGTAASVVRQEPSLSPADVEFGVSAAIAYAAVLHLLYGAVLSWLWFMVLRRRRWARIALTVALVLATLNSIDSATAGPEYLWWAVAGDVLHVGVIALLWWPRPAREYFAPTRPTSVTAQ
ncbi:hypothetical protein [Pseudonocardia sp. KRD291]|uniref:hypothetical protein n=1 Tax=Pseudonocardia sp. KRD291 TaxID=2792007 RepID=UPI001C4A27C3|nr:hypothetical protein [Pseudonocardia sp. KRD291]MBW0101756.1 hypothetical protein [Pseudonocardia sp. KRD291]